MSKNKKFMIFAGLALITLITIFNVGNNKIVQLNNYMNNKF